MRGSTGVGVPAGGGLRGSTATSNSTGLRGSGTDSGLRGSGQSTTTAAPHTDPMVVDARNVPTGLPKSVENSIPNTPAGNRIRKGFQAVMAHDWKVALAWFQDAHNQEPDNAGILRLIDLAEWTLYKGKRPQPPASPRQPNPADQAEIAATTAALDHIGDNWLENEMSEALLDYTRNGLHKAPKTRGTGKPAVRGNGGVHN